LTVATAKTLIVAAVFMELRHRRPLLLAFASAGLCWLLVLLWLASTDFTKRSGYPPSLGSKQPLTAPRTSFRAEIISP
jgi:hypothetical protein